MKGVTIGRTVVVEKKAVSVETEISDEKPPQIIPRLK
jgi:hypothetical protein